MFGRVFAYLENKAKASCRGAKQLVSSDVMVKSKFGDLWLEQPLCECASCITGGIKKNLNVLEKCWGVWRIPMAGLQYLLSQLPMLAIIHFRSIRLNHGFQRFQSWILIPAVWKYQLSLPFKHCITESNTTPPGLLSFISDFFLNLSNIREDLNYLCLYFFAVSSLISFSWITLRLCSQCLSSQLQA